DQQLVFQVIVRDPGGDVISAEGLRTVAAVEAAMRREAGDALLEAEQRPGVISYLAPALAAAEMRGSPLDALDDAAVATPYQAARPPRRPCRRRRGLAVRRPAPATAPG